MSYDSANHFYSNTPINNQNQQMTMMASPIRGSTNYSMTTPQTPMMNQYPSYPVHSSHQRFPSYETSESRSNPYYASNSGLYEHQQPPIRAMSYGENHIQSSPYSSTGVQLSSSMHDLNSRTRSNDYQNFNTMMPTNQIASRSFGYNNPTLMSTNRSISKSQQLYSNYSQQRKGDHMYDNNGVRQYSPNHPTMINNSLSTSNASTYQSLYQNEMTSTSGTVLSNLQQINYPSHSNESNVYLPPTPLQSTSTSTNAVDLDSNNAYSCNSQSPMYGQSSLNESHILTIQENDNNSFKTKPIQSNSLCESPSCTSISSHVPDDMESSNSSYSDKSPSVLNEKKSQKRKINKTTSIEVFNKLREMGNEQERNLFVDRLQRLWEEEHMICRKLPSISRQTIDLYRLYVCIREQNGFEQFSKVAKSRHWRDIASTLNIPKTSTAPFHLKQKYINFKLFHYECKYDRGGVDPDTTLTEIDKTQEQRLKTVNKKNDNKLVAIQDQPMSLSSPASSMGNSRIDNLPLQQSQTTVPLVSKMSQSSNLISRASNSSADGQLQQVPTLTGQLTKRSQDLSNLNSISKSILFPIGSIEATTISSKIKRKKLTVKDIPFIDSMKLQMSLRGGLLAETSWALDTINIMLNDDEAHKHLQLKQMPGLLQAVVDIYSKCLAQLFNEFIVENEQILNDSANKYQHRKKHDSIIYRIESNYLDKYQQKYNKQQNIIIEHIYDDHGNLKNNPEEVLNLQNTDDLSYIQTHFDPIHKDDKYYENLYYGHHHSNDTLSLDKHNGHLIKEFNISSYKYSETSGSDPIKSQYEKSDLLLNTIDDNKEFFQRYKRKFPTDEVYSNKCTRDFNSFLKLTDHEDNKLTLFTKYSSGYDQICSRCICVSSILRNLSFIPGNDIELVECKTLIHVLARILLLGNNINHTNTINTLSNTEMKELSNDQVINDDSLKNENQNATSSFSLSECLMNIRENTLVTLANIASLLIFDTYDSNLINELINGLLYWSTCYSDETIEQLQSSHISAQQLSIEILTKLSVHDMNMDFILATPSFNCILSLVHILIDWLNVSNANSIASDSYTNIYRSQTYIQREFSIVLLNALIRCDSNIAHIIAHIPYTISLLIDFLEDYEKKTNELITRYGSDYVLRLINTSEAENMLLTTNDMLTRAATCLLAMVNNKDNIEMLKKYEDRILNLSISNVIDRHIGRILTDILHHCSMYNS
ncbi:unnamed protein product [Rotaria magnacalcarata]|uniref:ARID domain-containing protein n=5 Tax=Rotaria magnacalcarata TaxID=392030 RepID=A0A819E397_9BILA|nr:unnamed protein product [Rotaria magnacalcarata]CAF3843947.1 unnamed protein product [Rotaria magnacalcarata]